MTFVVDTTGAWRAVGPLSSARHWHGRSTSHC